VTTGLKWPNDLVAWREGRLVKLAGIFGSIKGPWMVLGMGLNLGSAPVIPGRAIAPACVADLLPGAPLPDPEAMALEILEAWSDLTTLREPGFRWPEAGDPIRWEEGEGVCGGWLEDGRLAVSTAQGTQNLAAGDVSGMTSQ
jgi:biotin-(acetyl-CoA carboxylase) ligase